MSRRRNIAKAIRARLHGARWARTIADEAARAEIPYAVGFAAVEQESGFKNIFGHDPGGMYPGQRVTRNKVNAMVQAIRAGRTSNGVGLTQLTYPAFIYEAQNLGGAWKPRNQLRVGFKLLASLHRQHGNWHQAFKAYNGAGYAAENYARVMDVRVAKWERHLALPRKKR